MTLVNNYVHKMDLLLLYLTIPYQCMVCKRRAVTSRHAKIMVFWCTKWWKYPGFLRFHVYFFIECTFTTNFLPVTVLPWNIIEQNSSITLWRIRISLPRTYKCTTDIGERDKCRGHFWGILHGYPPSYLRFQMQNNLMNRIMWKNGYYWTP